MASSGWCEKIDKKILNLQGKKKQQGPLEDKLESKMRHRGREGVTSVDQRNPLHIMQG